MNRALYIGATSMIANQKRMDVLTNNLANVNTTGYKKEFSVHESFPEKLLAKVSRKPESNLKQKDNGFKYEKAGDSHLASITNGYFVMETKRGKSYIKDIKVIADQEGYLKTFYNDGTGAKTDYENYLLDKSGKRIQTRDGEGIEETLKNAVYNELPYVIGTMSRGVRFQKVVTDFSQGSFNQTGNNLDFALSRDGFFKVMDPETQKVYYTRSGSFGISNGMLKDLQGRYILSGGSPIQVDETVSQENIVASDDGTLFYNDVEIAKLDIVALQNRELLRKVGENRFEMVQGTDPIEIPYQGELLQGYIEASNVNSIDSMVEMITLQRDYDTNQRMVRTADEMLERAANELGRV